MSTKSVLLEDTRNLLVAGLMPVGDSSVTDLVCKWYKFDERKVKFELVTKRVISLAMQYAETEIYGCKQIILDSEIGAKRPYFCTSTKKKKGDVICSFITLFTTSSGTDETREDFRILTLANASCDSPIVKNLTFMDGPLLTWEGEKYLYFLLRVENGKFNLSQVRIRKMVKDHVRDPATIEYLGICEPTPRTCLVLLACRSEGKFLFFKVDCVDNKVELHDSSVPTKFVANVKSAELSYEKGEKLQFALVNRRNDVFFVRNGDVRGTLKFDAEPSLMFLMRHLAVLAGREIKIYLRHNFKHVETFTEQYCVIGDFVGRGSNQLLLLPEKPTNQNILDKFIISDFFTTYFNTDDLDSEPLSAEAEAAMQVFVKALQDRVNATVQWINEAQDEVERKYAHTRETVANINRMYMGEPTGVTAGCLTPFLRMGHNEPTPSTSDAERNREPPFLMLGTWQLIVLGKLCIGIEMRFRDEVEIGGVGLIPKEEFSSVVVTSEVVREQDGVQIVVMATDPPPMIQAEVACDVIMHYTCGKDLRSAVFGQIALKSLEMIRMMNEELALNVKEQRVLDALKVVQQAVRVVIKSDALQERDTILRHFQSLGFRGDSGGGDGCLDDEWYVPTTVGALGAMRAKLLSWLQGQVVMDVFHKDQPQMIHLVHSLYELMGDPEATIRRHHGDLPGTDPCSESSHNDESMYDSDFMLIDEP